MNGYTSNYDIESEAYIDSKHRIETEIGINAFEALNGKTRITNASMKENRNDINVNIMSLQQE